MENVYIYMNQVNSIVVKVKSCLNQHSVILIFILVQDTVTVFVVVISTVDESVVFVWLTLTCSMCCLTTICIPFTDHACTVL